MDHTRAISVRVKGESAMLAHACLHWDGAVTGVAALKVRGEAQAQMRHP